MGHFVGSFLKPKDKPKTRDYTGYKILPDGREICFSTPSGRREYKSRVRGMLSRQAGRCGLCKQPLAIDNAQFDHSAGRGMGGGHRDDRIWIPDGDHLDPINMAVCGACNTRNGSVRLSAYLKKKGS